MWRTDPPREFVLQELRGFEVVERSRAFWRRGRRWEITAFHRGSRTTIYSTRNRMTFNQVRRALLRAVEGRPKGQPGRS